MKKISKGLILFFVLAAVMVLGNHHLHKSPQQRV